MKVWQALVLALLGGLIYAVATSVLGPRSGGSEESPQALTRFDEDRGAILDRLAETNRHLAAIEASLTRLAGVASQDQPLTSSETTPAGLLSERPAPVLRGRDRTVSGADDAGSADSSGDATRLRELDQWKDRRDVRTRWLLTTDRELVRTFGIPDEVTATAQGEHWVYGYVERGMVVRWYRLVLHEGRVIHMETWSQDPPLSSPRGDHR